MCAPPPRPAAGAQRQTKYDAPVPLNRRRARRLTHTREPTRYQREAGGRHPSHRTPQSAPALPALHAAHTRPRATRGPAQHPRTGLLRPRLHPQCATWHPSGSQGRGAFPSPTAPLPRGHSNLMIARAAPVLGAARLRSFALARRLSGSPPSLPSGWRPKRRVAYTLRGAQAIRTGLARLLRSLGLVSLPWQAVELPASFGTLNRLAASGFTWHLALGADILPLACSLQPGHELKQPGRRKQARCSQAPQGLPASSSAKSAPPIARSRDSRIYTRLLACDRRRRRRVHRDVLSARRAL